MVESVQSRDPETGRHSGIWLIVLCLILLVIAAVFVVPVVLRANESARRTADKSNLSQIGKALGMYAEVPANMGRFPDSLDALYPNYIDDERVFQSPLVSKHRAGPGKLKFCDYFYFPGHTDTHGTAIIAFGPRKPGQHGGNILLGAGYVEWIATDKAFADSILKQLKSEGISLEITPDTPPEDRQWMEEWRKELRLDK